ncbi:PREDICTED: uncharacterized protein LOC109149562 isoform X2 [Ipomoea nil]|uniref:uncharacterized protein LOC109149562 isoform X2 n=1 Tax=Ipomoea nil TaxID=35883 RepID=UPI0009014AF7|nr:PREDICTED: uncharacterized protein LOC109149562 isoform X2 [Ipomoea nil]
MADKAEFDSRPNHISKDVQESNDPIPLSPQWLFPKPGENKAGIAIGENHLNPHSVYASRSDLLRSPGMVEDGHDHQKKKDVFRPSVMDMDPARRWREEERDINSSFRRDRWREGDKELGDNRKVDRWTDSSGRHYGDTRRPTTERWTDSGNRESNHDQRRESKWNTRWGPGDKEADGGREKWSDFSKDADMPIEKGSYKDEKDVDTYRPWRSNLSQSRGRAEPSHHQAWTPNKPVSSFNHGRGRGESAPPTFHLGRGRIPSGVSSGNNIPTHFQSHGMLSEKGESRNEEPSPFKYNRIKLFDVYRGADMRSCGKYLDGIVPIPSLMEQEPLEPLAFCAPSPEELVILKGIDKGDVVCSGVPQLTKDGSVGRNSSELLQSRSKLGSRDELQLSLNDSRDEISGNRGGGYLNHSETFTNEKSIDSYGYNYKVENTHDYERFSNPKLNVEASREGSFHRESESLLVDKESTMQRHSPALHGGMWRSSSFGEHSHMASKESREMPLGARSKISDVDWSQTQKDLNNEWERSLADSSYSQNNGPKSHFGDSSMLKSKHFAVLDKDLDMRKLSQPSPEDLVLHYKDPQGEIQGPFSGSDIIGWFEAGYFGIDLLVRLAGAPPDTPFSQLGDAMPHLRAKARAPPGFGTQKPNADASSGLNMNSFTQLHSGSAQIDVLKNEQRYKHSPSTEVENKFIESLMSNMSNGPLEKFPAQSDGFIGNNAGPVPSLGDESGGSMYLLAKKMALERQRSLPNPYSYWQGKDVASIVPTPDVVQDSLLHPKQSLIGDSARQQSHIQNVDLMSVLQGLPDRSAGMNSGTSSWSNFPAQGGLENIQNRLDMHHGLNVNPQPAFGIQQQRLLAQNTSIKNLLVPTLDNPPNISTSEKMISSGISHDPQMLSLLQKQYLLQLQSQAPPMPQQLSVLDKLLLLEQQQKHEQQQQLMLQQQQLLTQVMAEHHPSKQFGEQLYGQSQTAGMPSGITTLDHARFPSSGELSCMGSQAQVTVNGQASQFGLPISQAVSNAVGSEPSSTHLPHQIFGDIIGQRSWGANPQDQFNSVQQKGSFLETGVIDPLPVADVASKYPLEQTSGIEAPAVTFESTPSFPPVEERDTFVDLSLPSSCENDLSLNPQSDNIKPPLEIHEEPQAEGAQHSDEPCSVKEVKNVELHEVKKSSEKKSKRQKSAKMQASDTTRVVSKTQQFKSEGTSVAHVKADTSTDSSAIVKDSAPEKMENKNVEVASNVQPGQSSLPAHVTREAQNIETKGHSGQVGAVPNIDTENVSGLRAWKPAPGFKPKSLLEIQEEEQRRAQAETAVADIATSLNSISVSTPWAGVAGNSDPKLLRKTQQDAGNSLSKSDSSLKQKGKKSQLHDLLEESTGVKSNERQQITDITPSVPAAPISSSQADLDDDNFIEAKETKKSRKKSAKAKGSGTKSSVSIASVETSVSSPIDKVKSSRQLQPEKEVLPGVPSGPSLGDFVVWKGEPANPSPAPAWSTESGKVPKPTLLRDILKEQERKSSSGQQHIPVPTPQKSMSKQPTRGGSPSWSVTDSSPPKAASPMQINSRVASKTKNQIEDDFFWGSVDQPKQEAKQSNFPHLGTQGSWGNRNTPVKGTPGGSLSRQKSTGRPMEHTLSSSPATSSSLKGKKEALTKQSEAMDFREWCESECLRLLGTKDTSFLQFCLNQTRSEAEVLLTENLGSFDPDHEFIHKFLDYKDLLPADVLEIALQSGASNQKATSGSAADSTSDGAAFDVATKGGGRKKGKKGKKVSLSELGFNVVSNRIMMGEIQAVED